MNWRWSWLIPAGFLMVFSMARFWVLEPSVEKFLMALFLIIVCAPVKGLVYDRFSVRRPYRIALAANAASMLTGLSFHLGFDFWSLILSSAVISSVLETMVLMGFDSSRRLARAAMIALYATVVIHLISAGFLGWSRAPLIAAGAILAGFVLVHPPGILTDDPEPPGSD